jgi:hypothetical protein
MSKKDTIDDVHVNSAGAALKVKTSGNVLLMKAPVDGQWEIRTSLSEDGQVAHVWLSPRTTKGR